jgi:hypothetical protein
MFQCTSGRRSATRTALALSTLLSASAAFSACKEGVSFFPAPGAVVPPNTKFLLEAVGQEQKRAIQLVGSAALSLASADDVIPVTVSSAFISARGRVAIKLTPSRNLKPKKDYRLVGLGLVSLLNGGAADTPRWSTSALTDSVAPGFKVKPAVSEGLTRNDASGTSRLLRIHAVLEEASPSYFVITVQRQRSAAKAQQYFVAFDGAGTSVADDACFGPFELESGATYRMSLVVFDAAGNKGRDTITLLARAP